MKTAKISIGADISGFKKSIDNIKQSLGDLSKINLDKSVSSSAKNSLLDSLSKQSDMVKGKIKELTAQLDDMNSRGLMDTDKIMPTLKNISALNAQLKDINKTQKQINATGIGPKIGKFFGMGGSSGGGGGEEAGGGLMSTISMLGGPVGKAVGIALGGLGLGKIISSQFATRMGMAQQNMPIRALTSDADTIGSGLSSISQFGFTGEQRRSRALDIAGNAGGITGANLEKLVDSSEKAERMYGISGSQYSESVGAIRKSGGTDPDKTISRSIGLAVAAGLQGSQISEFLSQSTSYLQSMSEGVNIDQSSLEGFASSLSSLPFFRNDPARAFGAMKGMNSAFQSDDPFMKAQATRAIVRGLPAGSETSPAATELRRGLGLYGFGGNKGDDELVARMRKTGGGRLADTLSVGGTDIVKNTFKDIQKSTEGQSYENQAYAFKERTGLPERAALEIFQTLKEGKDVTKEQLQDATMTDTERLGKIMGSNDGRMVELGSTMNALKETVANLTTSGILPLTGVMTDLIKTMNPNYGKEAAPNPLSDAGKMLGSDQTTGSDWMTWMSGLAGGKGGSDAMRPFTNVGMNDVLTPKMGKSEMPAGSDIGGLTQALSSLASSTEGLKRATDMNTNAMASEKKGPNQANFDWSSANAVIPTKIPGSASTASPTSAVQGR